MKQTWKVGILILTCLLLAGCQSESRRLADMADQTVRMQAEQNIQSANSQNEFAKLNRDLQLERKTLNQQFGQLESERRELHQQRRSELAWAESFRVLAIVIAAVMPLFLCALLIWAATRKANSKGVYVVYDESIQDLVAKQPHLIAGPDHSKVESQSKTKAINLAGSHISNNQNNNEGIEDNVTHC